MTESFWPRHRRGGRTGQPGACEGPAPACSCRPSRSRRRTPASRQPRSTRARPGTPGAGGGPWHRCRRARYPRSTSLLRRPGGRYTTRRVLIRWAFLKRVLAGAIFGLYMAHLLYFINPQIDVTVGRLVLVTTVYGLICGLLFGLALWGLRAIRVKLFGRPGPEAYRTHGFGFVPFAALSSAAIYWIHVAVLRSYLPIGAVRILSKATITLASTGFALLLL